MTSTTFYLLLVTAMLCTRNVICRWFAGWNRIESHFPCGKPEYIGLQSKGSYLGVSGAVSFLPMHFNVEVCRDFLWIRPAAFGMKGVSIPWKAIERISIAKGLFRSVGTVALKDVDVTLRMSGRAATLAFEIWKKKQGTGP
jgi:hypothetical protein